MQSTPNDVLAKSVLLTARQVEVLQWLRSGKTNREIACIINTTEHTVKYHLKVIFEKLGVVNRAQAAARAAELERGSGYLATQVGAVGSQGTARGQRHPEADLREEQ